MTDKALHTATLIRSTGSWYEVFTDTGAHLRCKFKGKYKIAGIKSTNPLAVGDRVEVREEAEEGVGMIVRILPRKNYIIRKATKLSSRTHIIATNIDYAFLVVTQSQPRTSLGFIDRFLLSCEAYHIPAVLVFNKSDLNQDEEAAQQADRIALYSSLGYRCIETSATQGQGIAQLRDMMRGHICMFGGHSGVGKSALINSIEPALKIRVGAISQVHRKGQHTTTFAEMHPLSNGGWLIDTPGIKELGLVNFDKTDVAGYMPEMKALIGQCRFNNCMHVKEPECAVKTAVQEGQIRASRYTNYLSMIEDDTNY